MAAAPLLMRAAGKKNIPIGLKLYSVPGGLKKDPMATLRGVAKVGYECVECFSSYYDWDTSYAKQVRHNWMI